MIIRVLIINRQLVFAVTIKQALEQTGAFEVHPFTDPNAAIEYLRTHPHDIALVDFEIQVMSGPEIVARLREVQPEIALIVSPAQLGKVLQQLDIQDTVDVPFSARGIIPMIERAVEQVSNPSSAITRSFVQPDEGANLKTDILPDEPPEPPSAKVSEFRGSQTRLLEEDSEEALLEEYVERPQTRILDDEEGEDVPPAPAHTLVLEDDEFEEALPEEFVERAQTRILDDDQGEEVPPTPAHTRVLDDDEFEEALPEEFVERAQTRIFDDDQGESEPPAPAQTRILDDDDLPPSVPEEVVTRKLDDESPTPPTLPEFSSLDHVLSDEAPSALFEPPVRDGDTPAVPDVASDAVRQYLATTSDPEDSVFDDMLSVIPPDEQGAGPSSEGSSFDDLVNSMRAQSQHTPLPDRHQQFVEFILTGGMDHLLSEIGKSNDEPPTLPEQAPEVRDADTSLPDVFQRLAADEPPLPSLEDSGTIGDLMVGVSDTSFRNVLAMMRGQEVIDDTNEQSAQLRKELEAAYASFFEQEMTGGTQDDDDDDQNAPMFFPDEPEEDDPDSAIPARLILETALDESTPIESFSLGGLIGDIERQLVEHTPNVTPLPSWKIDAFQPKRRRQSREEVDELERYVREPDFLPEELPYPTTEDESIAEKLSRAANLTEDDLAVLGRDLFDEMISDEIQQQASLEVEQITEDEATESWDTALPEEVAHEQDTVPHAAIDAPSLPEDEALIEADDTLPETLWDGLADEWDEAETWEDADAEIEAEDTQEWQTLLEEEPSDYAQETVLHQWEDESELPVAPDEMLSADETEALPVSDEERIDDDAMALIDWDDEATGELEAFEELETAHDFEDEWHLTIDESLDEQTALVERPGQEQGHVDLGSAADFVPEIEPFDLGEPDDPYVAQIALSLTQMSLELAAEATLIANEEEIVAIAGHLDQADIEEIRDAIADDWDANPDEARVRFITLPSSSKDYMLYSRKTVGNFTLSMIFAGTTPLRDIRRQGKRLLDALQTVPETVAKTASGSLETTSLIADDDEESEVVEPVDVGVLQSYTYLWLFRDPDVVFDERLSRIVATSLQMQLLEIGWQVKTLQAQDEYVYIRADVPGEQPAHEVIDDLKHRVAEIMRAQNPDMTNGGQLWADSYLVMMPGRELDPEEISQFISFERMF